MHSRHIRPWVSLVLASLFLSTLARECVLEDRFLDSSEEVHEALAGCTTVIADKVSIGGASGRLVLPDVVNITGVIYSTGLSHFALSTPLMTSIEAPQLVHLGGLDLNSISSVANLSFPKLQHVAGQIRIEHPQRYVNLDFPVLEDAKSIYLDGDFGRLGFRHLQRVDNDLIVRNCEGCKASYIGKTTPDPVTILFPALESVGFIKLAGVISNISLPQLVSAGPPITPDEPKPDLYTRPNSSDSGIRLHMTELSSPFELQLPSLSSVDKQLYIHGEIKKFVFVQLPSLAPDVSITLESIYECDPYDPGLRASYASINCPVSGNGLDKYGKVGVGLGVAMEVILFAGIGLLLCRKHALKRKTLVPVIEQELSTLPVPVQTRAENLPQTQAEPTTAPPPPYSPSPL